jgi:hypothetical protein
LGDRGLLLRLGFGLAQFALLLGGDLLTLVGADLLVGDLTLGRGVPISTSCSSRL